MVIDEIYFFGVDCGFILEVDINVILLWKCIYGSNMYCVVVGL